MIPLRIFIGWDDKESVAWHVLAHSILKRASRPVALIPLVQSQLREQGIYTRERGPLESTDFSLTRFLVPYLSGFEGFSVFMDCDMLCLTDIGDLLKDSVEHSAPSEPAVWLCKHNYTPKGTVKMDGQAQTTYPKKNWSSLMVFDNARCRVLTPEYVNAASGLGLHQFSWLGHDEVGSLPLEWNYLIGEGNQSPEPPKILHFTQGGPWFYSYRDVPHADLWRDEESRMLGEA